MTRARDLSNLIGSGNYSQTTLTATAGQTSFTVSHTPNFVQVFMNGLLLDPTVDFTANGTTIVLTEAAAVGDELEVVTYETFSVGDAITQTEADTRYVLDTADVITVSGSNVGIGTSSPVAHSNRTTLGLQGAWGGQLDIMVGSTVHAQFGTDNFDSGLGARIESKDGIVFKGAGSTERMRIDSSGRVTKPYQPYFLANNYGQVKTVGWHLLDFTTSVEHNVGNHYSTSGSKFTAPVAGVYSFSVGGYVPEDNNGQRYAYSFYVNGNGGIYISGGQQSSPDGPLSTHTQKIKLNANDYVQVYMYMPTVTTLGATYHRMWFNGCLIG